MDNTNTSGMSNPPRPLTLEESLAENIELVGEIDRLQRELGEWQTKYKNLLNEEHEQEEDRMNAILEEGERRAESNRDFINGFNIGEREDI